MSLTTEQNKQVVLRFNKECLEQGNPDAFRELLAPDVINHAAPPGMPNGPESFTHFLNGVLRKGFPDLRVEILEQVAEGDLVCTRKKITARHTGEIFGIAPSNKQVVINVIDIIRVKDGRYAEHWGQSNFTDVLKEITS
ncbi:ester cyclase [Flavitalea sp. BT771]|uniref:ester cyclase n=1 Tax=Flavitalea sp. BT771 TaxID=3063329 RepID=UPI0026E46FF1|nr:ester cyclase [Flavitalea sp. BT771]MDO6429091.1 ester cyclase [Flavitalea sp. BT771]MDV6218781.1 ester cyclase [Flavitalea sp. BT771]